MDEPKHPRFRALWTAQHVLQQHPVAPTPLQNASNYSHPYLKYANSYATHRYAIWQKCYQKVQNISFQSPSALNQERKHYAHKPVAESISCLMEHQKY